MFLLLHICFCLHLLPWIQPSFVSSYCSVHPNSNKQIIKKKFKKIKEFGEKFLKFQVSFGKFKTWRSKIILSFWTFINNAWRGVWTSYLITLTLPPPASIFRWSRVTSVRLLGLYSRDSWDSVVLVKHLCKLRLCWSTWQLENGSYKEDMKLHATVWTLC